MEKGSANTPRNEWYFANCSDFDAALGRTDEAIREARQAVEMHPIAQDPINGTTMVGHLARAYAAAGDRDHAIEQLEMLAKIPPPIFPTANCASIKTGIRCVAILASKKWSLP